jgi:hypothetical protein
MSAGISMTTWPVLKLSRARMEEKRAWQSVHTVKLRFKNVKENQRSKR